MSQVPSKSDISGAQIARYYERVLGVRSVSKFELPKAEAARAVAPTVTRPVCLLIEVGSASAQPSIQQMGARLVEAVRNEWLKRSIEALPEIEWLQAGVHDWASVIEERGRGLVLAIVCGAQESPTRDAAVVHVASFDEMNSSPVVKRDAWRAIQAAIAKRA